MKFLSKTSEMMHASSARLTGLHGIGVFAAGFVLMPMAIMRGDNIFLLAAVLFGSLIPSMGLALRHRVPDWLYHPVGIKQALMAHILLTVALLIEIGASAAVILLLPVESLTEAQGLMIFAVIPLTIYWEMSFLALMLTPITKAFRVATAKLSQVLAGPAIPQTIAVHNGS